MSYDFTLFALEPNTDLDTILAAREQTNGLTRFAPQSKQHSQAIADALRLRHPKLNERPVVMTNLEFIELDTEGNRDGIQISLFPNEVSVTVPYWHKASQAPAVFRQIWDYLRTIQRVTDFVIYDPQVGRIIDLETDFDRVLATYLGTMDKIDDIGSHLANPQAGVRVNPSLPSQNLYATDDASLILFRDPNIGLKEAAHILKNHALTVEDRGEALQVQWQHGLELIIRLSRGTFVKQLATEIGKDTPFAADLVRCDACFGILVEDLERALEETNTLFEIQVALQSATGGFLFNTWNSHLLPPEA